MNSNYLTWAVAVGIIFLFGHGVESSSLVKPPCSNDLSGFLSMLFGLEIDQPDLKYDKKNHEWVEDCPEVDCQYGIDEGDSETCPSCLLGPGESCGDWKGKCGEKLACQYQSTYSSTGKCISEEEFKSRNVGDSCGYWEGKCVDGLKCLVEPDPLTYFCGIEESGVCVTEENFSSRQEGETCGDSAGNCKEGLECVQSDYCWFASECRNLTKEEGKPQHHEHVISIEEVIHNSESKDGKEDRHISIELITDDDDSDEEKVIEEIFQSEFLSPFLGPEIEEEAEMIEEIVHSVMTKTNATEEDKSSQKITKTIENPETEETKTVMVEMESSKSAFSPIVFDSQSAPEVDEKIKTSQPTVEMF